MSVLYKCMTYAGEIVSGGKTTMDPRLSGAPETPRGVDTIKPSARAVVQCVA